MYGICNWENDAKSTLYSSESEERRFERKSNDKYVTLTIVADEVFSGGCD